MITTTKTDLIQIKPLLQDTDPLLEKTIQITHGQFSISFLKNSLTPPSQITLAIPLTELPNVSISTFQELAPLETRQTLAIEIPNGMKINPQGIYELRIDSRNAVLVQIPKSQDIPEADVLREKARERIRELAEHIFENRK